ncbi:hypothetical protein AAFF_G00238450 [Aldrovandia affinis]|uniref:Outer dense fiber protein 3-like protein 2 n=1 Tax=Aldrovandia affinis TaxID=143900 RepID=A0AAD7RES4_9TELE|nr:hypothetical protein AAFF_G00238450 [Aldrovandia affinis]
MVPPQTAGEETGLGETIGAEHNFGVVRARAPCPASGCKTRPNCCARSRNQEALLSRPEGAVRKPPLLQVRTICAQVRARNLSPAAVCVSVRNPTQAVRVAPVTGGSALPVCFAAVFNGSRSIGTGQFRERGCDGGCFRPRGDTLSFTERPDILNCSLQIVLEDSMGETEKKRPIIAGRERGPGPGRYALPPTIGYIGHDYTKPASPAYSFHRKMSSKLYSVDSSPGPRYNIDAKLTRFGRDGTPSYSMLGRSRGSAGLFQTPGPGAYSPEAAPPLNSHRRPPSYTMGARTCYRTLDAVPAPNKYTLPVLMGSHVPTKPASACYSMSARCKSGGSSQDMAMTPGPGKYNSTDPNVYLPRRPAFSMLRRYTVPSDATRKPGPGTHDAEKVVVNKPRPTFRGSRETLATFAGHQALGGHKPRDTAASRSPVLM